MTSQRDSRRVRLANIARSNMAAFPVRLLQLQQVAENPSLEQEEFLYIQLFRGRLSEENVHATIPKGNMGYDQYTVPDTVAVELSFVAFL